MTSSAPDPTPGDVASDVARPRVASGEDVGCGEFLRRARQARGLTLQQIAQTTKIPLRHLDALEHDEFAALPGGMYRRAHVRAYAAAVGIDPGVALAWFDRTSEEAVPPVAPVAAVRAASPAAANRSRVLIAGAAAFFTAVFALAIWARQPAARHISSSAAPVSPAASDVVAASQAPTDAAVASSGRAVELASAPRRERPEPAAVPPGSNAVPGTASDETTAPESTVESQLTVITEPAGARVTVNGIGWGTTPVTIRYLPSGPKRVRVTKEGYRAEERFVQLETRSTTVRIPLRSED